MGDDELSFTEHETLAAVLHLNPNGYGITIRDALSSLGGNPPSIGKVYATIERLERRGYLKTHLGVATAERGGRRKMHYSITGLGRSALLRSCQRFEGANSLIPEGALA